MAKNISVNDQVFVPQTLLGIDPTGPSPFYKTIVRGKQRRSVRVELPNGDLSEWIGTSKISKNPGVMIVGIGDYEEKTLLEPLHKSILQFFRILLPDDHVISVKVRTLEEIKFLWDKHNEVFQQIVLIGHGSPNSILFGATDVNAGQLINELDGANGSPKEFISLCCQTGQAPFAKSFSEAAFCSDFLAPFHSVHGCVASQFCQNYMTLRLLDGQTTGYAFNRARKNLIGATSFRRWHNGTLKSGPK